MTTHARSGLAVDVTRIPWSYRGSYLSCSTLVGDRGLGTPNIDVALVSHFKPYGAPCFVMRPEVKPLPAPTGFHTTPSPVTYKATPGALRWVHGGVTVAQATFQSDRIMRFAGTLPFSFDTDQQQLGSYFYPLPKLTESSRDTVDWASMGLMPLRLVALQGSISTINSATFKSGRVTIHPDESGNWQLVVAERSPSDDTNAGETSDDWLLNIQKVTVGECNSHVDRLFAEYARAMMPWQEVSDLDLHACYIMWTSTVRGEGFLKKEAVLMSKLWMNKVWSWDNCFNALALASHPDLLQSALDNLMEPFNHQLSDGRIPDAIMYNEITWDFVKPPIQGWTLERLLTLRPDIPTESLHDIYGPLSRFTNMWLHTRRCTGSELPYYIHGNDSGWDNSTSFMADNVIINADLASHLILQTNILAYLSRRLDRGEDDYWVAERTRLVKALISELWDGEMFLVKRVSDGSTSRSSSLLQLVPLTASRFLPKDIVDKMMAQVESFTTSWGLASEPPSSPHYESDGYWRGPIWAPSTILLESGLREAGHTKLADDIRSKFFELCAHGGFAENFDAVTGDGHRDLSHTWTSSIYLIFRQQASGIKKEQIEFTVEHAR